MPFSAETASGDLSYNVDYSPLGSKLRPTLHLILEQFETEDAMQLVWNFHNLIQVVS